MRSPIRISRAQVAAAGLITLIFTAACGDNELKVSPTITALDQPTSTPAVVAMPTPTPSPVTPIPPTPVAIPLTTALKLELASPKQTTLGGSSTTLVSGFTSPDATLSVNGRLAMADPEGKFSVEVDVPAENKLFSIEVIATSISGGRRAVLLRPVGEAWVTSGTPLRTSHFVGVVTAAEKQGLITLRDYQGHQITGTLGPDLAVPKIGEVITAIMSQDVSTGTLQITGLDPALSLVSRTESALEQARLLRATNNLAALKDRLQNNSARHLTMLLEMAARADPGTRPAIESAFRTAVPVYSSIMSRYNAGIPAADISGIITAIDRQHQKLTIKPSAYQPMELAVGADTSVQVEGQKSSLDSLKEFWRVNARYSLDSRTAMRLDVSLGETLDPKVASLLLPMADKGEAVGVVVRTDLVTSPPSITIEDEVTQTALTLKGALAVVEQIKEGELLAAKFSGDSRQITELERLGSDPEDLDWVSGVVQAFVSKPGIAGNVTIQTTQGEILRLDHHDQTVIRRDGRRVSVNEVRLGDLVRPNTRYLADGKQVLVLSLKSPSPAEVQGTIRGINRTSDGARQITVGTETLELVSFMVSEGTKLTRQGSAALSDELTVGQRIVMGTYDPISLKAISLDLSAASSSGQTLTRP